MRQIDKKTNKNDIVAADEEERFEQNSEANDKNDKGSDSESGEEDNGPFVDVMPFSTNETYEMRVQTVNKIQCFFAESGTELRSNTKLMGLN